MPVNIFSKLEDMTSLNFQPEQAGLSVCTADISTLIMALSAVHGLILSSRPTALGTIFDQSEAVHSAIS